MVRTVKLSAYRCYHCGSPETRKEGTQDGRQRYLCKACGRFSIENAAFRREDFWGKRSGARCYHCGSDETVKAGKDKGKKRFKCRNCGKYFREDPILPSGETTRNRVKYDLPAAGQLILELQSLAQDVLKKTPTTNEIIELSKEGRCHSLATYYAVFGSYVEAVRRSRLKQHYLQQFGETDRARMLQELRALSKRLKRPLVGKDVRKAAAPDGVKGKRLPSGSYDGRVVSPINHYQAVFGSIPKAIAAAGVAPKISYTKAEMIAVLRKLAAGLDRPVQKSDLEKLHREGKGPSPGAVDDRFGGLGKARKAAGVLNSYRKGKKSTRYWQKYTLAELIAQLKGLAKKLGRRPTLKEINRSSKLGECASHTSFASMFGSLPEAYQAAGFFEIKKNERKWTDKEIVAAIKKLKKELGHFPGFHDLLAGSKA